jgi:DNA-directed RNA polymerase specialized sigma24 family protein
LQLVVVDGLTYEEAAWQIGCSREAVHARLYRARTTLLSLVTSLMHGQVESAQDENELPFEEGDHVATVPFAVEPDR